MNNFNLNFRTYNITMYKSILLINRIEEMR